MPGQWTRRLGPCLSQTRSISTASGRSKARQVTSLAESDLGPTQQHGHRTVRKRVDGKKELPLPPLLDPVVLERKSRYKQKKARPSAADFTPFQRKLWENPFGRPYTCGLCAIIHIIQHTRLPRLSENAVHTHFTCRPTCSSASTFGLIPLRAIRGCFPCR